MSYERKMLEGLAMPPRNEVEKALLRTLLKHGGVIREFGAGQEIVDELANDFGLNRDQRSAFLQTIYRKENRPKKALLWHRLLFRAADSLARENLVSRPTQTFRLTNRKGWMLTEAGFDRALRICNVPRSGKEFLPIKTYEVQKIVKRLTGAQQPVDYDPINAERKVTKTTSETILRIRGFRQAVIETYGFRCAVCGLKINSPDCLSWEVEAAHIVPCQQMGRDDIWNGIGLCHLHHWAFDVGWFTFRDDYRIDVLSRATALPSDYGRLEDYDFVRALSLNTRGILLPENRKLYPHQNAIRWHRENIFLRNKGLGR